MRRRSILVDEHEPIARSIHRVWPALTKLSSCRLLLQQYCDDYSKNSGVLLELDDRQFTQAFVAWTQILEDSEFYLHKNAADYFQFCIGALLAELLKFKAVRDTSVTIIPHKKPSSEIADWWPTGFALTHFCVELVKKVSRQECGKVVESSEKIGQLKIWQSYRENLLEEPMLAIAYFDDFMGITPNWRTPYYAGHRTAGID